MSLNRRAEASNASRRDMEGVSVRGFIHRVHAYPKNNTFFAVNAAT